ncbi:MAG TPA: MBL fold metallo-hydrolase [Chloroflexota bacterium]|jgi:glyoxylase-like metal-dependent hydrolase (beta-lactamase superfamily II)
MRRVTDNVYAEVYFTGCNPSYLATSEGVVMFDTPQQPIDAVRWRERLQEHGAIRYLINTEPHIDHIAGNAYFPGVEVIGQAGIQPRYEQSIAQMTGPERLDILKQNDPDSVWLFNHPDFPPNPPTRTFGDGLTLRLGNHSIECTHLPGHTAPQTAIYLPEEGVLITGDNIFQRTKTWLQECDPWEWLDALKVIESYDTAAIIPGHGEVCDYRYVQEQRQVIEDWVGAIEDFVQRGLTEEESLKQPAPAADPYPLGQRLHHLTDRVNGMNVSNLYKRVAARQQGPQSS